MKKKKKQDKTAEQIWQAYITGNPDQEWTSLSELLPPDAQEDLIMDYYFMSFSHVN